MPPARSSAARAALAAVAGLLLTAAGSASAAGTAPFTALWSAPGGAATQVVLTQGPAPRAAWAGADGQLVVKDLLSGAAVGAPVPLGTGPRLLTGFGGAVAPVSSSRGGEDGQLYVVVNDVDGLAIVQVDEATGTLVQRAAVPGSSGQLTSSAPVVTEPDAGGTASLLFTSVDREDWETAGAAGELWRVTIRGVQTTGAQLEVASADRGARAAQLGSLNAVAAPALLPEFGRTLVAVGTGSASAPVQTLDAGGFCGDPLLCSRPQTGPSSGPLVADAGADRAVFAFSPLREPGGGVLVPSYDERTDRTIVHRLDARLVEVARSLPVPGRPGPGLAAGETVVVATGRDLVALDGMTLKLRWRLGGTAGLQPGTTGFGRTGVAVADGTAFATRDDGRRLAFRLADGTPVAPDRFDADTGAGTAGAVGAPVASVQGIVVFGTATGVVALRDRCGSPAAGSPTADRFQGTAAGDAIAGLGGDDLLEGADGDDCLAGDAGADRLSGEAGEDRLDGGAGGDRLNGGPAADGLTGVAGDDSLSGAEGNDTLDGGSGRDVARGGLGADVLTGGPGPDQLFGDAAGDGLAGGAGDDRLDGGTGLDRLRGGAGRDVLYGRSGNDRLIAGPGGGKAFGGTGDDRIDTRNGAVDVVDCGPGVDVLLADARDRARRCE